MIAPILALAALAQTALALPGTTPSVSLNDNSNLTPVPRADQVSTSFRQTSRREILDRAMLKTKRAERRAARGLGKRQTSDLVYAQCAPANGKLAQAATGFASITGWAVPQSSSQNIVSCLYA